LLHLTRADRLLFLLISPQLTRSSPLPTLNPAFSKAKKALDPRIQV
jgi:hypothetical protein